jgi:SAM-dependent methyltransferase
MYSVIKRVVTRIRDIAGKNNRFDGKQYWEARAVTYGKNAVLNLAHKETEFDQVTASQREILLPLFTNQLLGSERSVLDFGCGPGRFTQDLAEAIHGSAVGVDISEKLIQLARPGPNVTFRVAASGEIPGNIAEFDVVWICLVLGGIPEVALRDTIVHLEAVLKPGGLMFLIENTAQKPDGAYWFFRTASYYQSLFPSIDLQRISSYTDVSEEISIFAVRKSLRESPLPLK